MSSDKNIVSKNFKVNTEYDKDIYGEDKGKYTSVIEDDEELNEDEEERNAKSRTQMKKSLNTFTAPKEIMEEIEGGEHKDPFQEAYNRRISAREDSYHKKRYRPPSPTRKDPLSMKDNQGDSNERTYKDIMLEQKAQNEKVELMRKQQKMTNKRESEDKIEYQGNKRARYDAEGQNLSDTTSVKSGVSNATKLTKGEISEWDKIEKGDAKANTNLQATPKWDSPNKNLLTPNRRRRWDLNTSSEVENLNSNSISTPQAGMQVETTPTMKGNNLNNRYLQETPTPGRGKTKWDETPENFRNGSLLATPNLYGATPTPQGAFNMATPTPGIMQFGMAPLENLDNVSFNINTMTLENMEKIKMDREMIERNKPMTDEELDQILPHEGYEILKPPEGYQPPVSRSNISNLQTSFSSSSTPVYQIPDESKGANSLEGSNIPNIKPEDVGYFSSLLANVDESKLSPEEQRDRKIMTLLLKVKNGTPPMRKSSLRQLTEKARDFGAGPLFNQILPLLMSPTLEDQERHLLVKVVDRVLFKLDDLVRPYVHKILVVIEPMLIDEDYYARIEGREIISNLAKAAGLATMISTMRPDIDSPEEYVRNITARSFAVVASALGLPVILPFLKAVCQSKRSWQARHTGIKIIQQIAILMGCAILPYLKNLVEIIEHGLKDEQQKVRTITALAIASLAEAAHPFGIEAFATVIRHLFDGMKQYKGKGLAAFFKAIGFIIPLMDAELAARSTKLVIPVLKRDFTNPDEEMKKIVLKVLKQCISTEGVEASYVKNEIKDDFFACFWNRRMALERKNYKQLIETTVEIANKILGGEIIEKLVEFLKDESEPFRKMTLETIDKIISILGVADVNTKIEQTLIDGLLFCFQEQSCDDSQSYILLNCFGTVVNALGLRIKGYLPHICGTIQWRLNNKNAQIRQQAADLIVKVAHSMMITGEENLMGRIGVVLTENLGEEYPEVLGSIIAALKAIVSVIGLTKMTPPIKDLLPRLTPILKNRHEKVQENVIDLIGKIADKGASFVSAKEWMRICFDLLELLKAHKKSIRRATVNTFGYIAKAIGPQEVLVTLLNNLKVQERQNRVCTTVAIAIVSETCGPFTVIPALMNEYRVPELNVQNGVLKSFSFLFEYIGEMARDYIYSVIPLLEDALTDRDLVHRQTAASAIKHLALGVAGLNCEDALVHLLNYVWPNIFETSPHVINAVMEAIEGLRVGLGVNRLMSYIVQGLFHPARRVRDAYWKIYNMMYIGSADALVPCYPILPNDKKNTYTRSELELFI